METKTDLKQIIAVNKISVHTARNMPPVIHSKEKWEENANMALISPQTLYNNKNLKSNKK